jgi:hypothetical protein
VVAAAVVDDRAAAVADGRADMKVAATTSNLTAAK